MRLGLLIFAESPFQTTSYVECLTLRATILHCCEQFGKKGICIICADTSSFRRVTLLFAFRGKRAYLLVRLLENRAEIERRKATLDTLEKLTLTVAHYIRNANSTVGGYSRRLLTASHDAATLKKLELIRNASDQIEAVVASLQTIDEKTQTEEVGATEIRMLNIRDTVELKMRLLKQTAG